MFQWHAIVVYWQFVSLRIIVGNRGMGALSGHLLGSVPGDIAHRAPCDVLIVQTEQIAREDQLSA
jgi:universal stress protein family protein